MKNNKLLWIISFIPFILSCAAIPFLPDQIPMHYDIEGTIDRWGSKYETFIFPLIILALALMWQCFINYYAKKSAKADNEKAKAELASNIKVLRFTAIATAIGFAVMHIINTYSGYVEAINHATQSHLDFHTATNVIWGIIIILLGNYLPKAKRNNIIGFRTRKSLTDDTLWRKSNRFAGISLMLAGTAIVIESLLIGGPLSTLLMLTLLLAAALTTTLYTLKL